MSELGSDLHRNASVVTVQQLVGAPTGDAHADCAVLTEQLFPDDTDALWFSLVVPDRLYERMRTITEDVRRALVDLLRTDTVRAFDGVPPRLHGCRRLERAYSYPGAPRKSWAGASRALPTASFASSDGVFVMALQQSRAVFGQGHDALHRRRLL